jgi:hypothetical protein
LARAATPGAERSTGTWYTLNSATDYTASSTLHVGGSSDMPAPGDYDGDGVTNPAVYTPATGV